VHRNGRNIAWTEGPEDYSRTGFFEILNFDYAEGQDDGGNRQEQVQPQLLRGSWV